MVSRKFTELYKNLNKAQKQAVDTIEGPVMVIAGPGTGKTTILTMRIANILLKTDTPASGILAITFTEAGVQAMRMKLRDIIGTRADEIGIFTFHGFASSIIAENPDHFPQISGSTPLSDVEGERIIRDILTDGTFSALRPLGKPDLFVSSILRTISDAKHEAYTPEMVREFAKVEMERIAKNPDAISTRGASKGELKAEAKRQIEKCERTLLFAGVYERYEQQKKENNRIDFDDLIIELIQGFRRDELLLRLMQERYLYIHVDEHQDTNDSQNQIISFLADFFETPNLFIVGDEKQAIYRFQGASVENFLKFEARWKDMTVISLDTSYRSHQHILDSGFSMIEHNYAAGEFMHLRRPLHAGLRATAKPIEIISAPTNAVLQRDLVERIRSILAKQKKANIAVIVRRNRDIETLLPVFEKYNIPVGAERKIDIFAHPAGKLFFDLIEFFVSPTDTAMLGNTIVAGLWNLSFDGMIACLNDIRHAGTSAAVRHIPLLKELHRELSNESPLQFLVSLAEKSGYVERITRDPASVEVWRGIFDLATVLVKHGPRMSSRELMEALISYRESAESRSVKVSVGVAEYPVRLMTAHGSKGLEFDYVFIPYANDEVWVPRAHGSFFVLPRMRSDGDDVRDARRLFYVALTRARSHVVILFAGEEEGGRTLSPLRFLQEFPDVSVSRDDAVKHSISKIQRLRERARDEVRCEQLHDFTKTTLLERGLSVTALNHFLDCPSRFLYQSVLKLPQKPSATAEKGTVMHTALAAVWKGGIRTTTILEEQLRSAIADFKKTSSLAPHERESVVKELTEAAPVVGKALAGHFAEHGTVFAEEWSKTSFECLYEKKPITIPLHGKLDVVLDTGKQILVFDYKTKQVMSEAAIKGETKSSDGGYFRQLIFYKLLLSKDSRFCDKPIVPALVFVSPDAKGRCQTVAVPISTTDVARVEEEIRKLISCVWDGSFLRDECRDSLCEWCAVKRMTLGR